MKFSPVLFAVLLAAGNSFAATATSVSQYGITWTFSQACEVGQFANGDYWVVGPVSITSITPNYTGSMNGWMANPAVPHKQGFDSRGWGGGATFDAASVPSLPYLAQPNTSIIKAVSLQTSTQTNLKTAAVLTVVGAVPPGNGAALFRPPYFGTEKRTTRPTPSIFPCCPSWSPPPRPGTSPPGGQRPGQSPLGTGHV
jgi:hypothetical protein